MKEIEGEVNKERTFVPDLFSRTDFLVYVQSDYSISN